MTNHNNDQKYIDDFCEMFVQLYRPGQLLQFLKYEGRAPYISYNLILL